MESYKPSIVHLCEMLGWQATPNNCQRPDFWSVVFKYGTDDIRSSIPPELAQALRICLHDFPDARGVQPAANMLLRNGFDFPDLIPRLTEWDQLFFKWKGEDITVESIRNSLKQIGFDHFLSPEALTSIANRISNPVGSLVQYRSEAHSAIAGILFGLNCIVLAQYNLDDPPPIAETFSELFNRSNLRDKITEAQSAYDDCDKMVTHFLLGEQTYRFEVSMVGNCSLNEQSIINEVLVNFDALLANIGRKERVINLNIQPDYPEQAGWVVVAEPDGFIQFCNRLHIPASRVQAKIKPTLQISPDFKYPTPLPDVISGSVTVTPDNLSRYKNIAEAERIEIKGKFDCEFPQLTKAKSITIDHGSGNIVFPRLSHIEERLWVSGLGSLNIKAESLVSVGGDVIILTANTINFPHLKSIGGELQVMGRSPRVNEITHLNAPKLAMVNKIVKEGHVNVILDVPKLRERAGIVQTIAVKDHPEHGYHYWAPRKNT